MNNIIQIKRRLNQGGALPGAPLSLSGGELAFNEVDSVLYYGYNDGTVNGDNNPGTIIGIAGPGLFVDRTTDQTVGGIKTFTDTVSALGNVEVDGNVDANSFSINGTTIVDTSKNATFANIDASGDLVVQGDFTVYGNSTTIETLVTAASAFTIESASNTPALTVKQYGPTDVAVFYDGDTANTAFIIKDGGNVGINTSAPNKTLTVVGDISATGTLDITNSVNLNSTLTVTDDTTLNGKLYVDDAVSFNSSLSAKGSVEIDSTLTVDDLATFNADVTVVDKLQVQSTDYDGASNGSSVAIEGTNIAISDVTGGFGTTYGIDGITVQQDPTFTYNISTQDTKIVITAGAVGAENQIDLNATSVNVSTNLDVNGTTTLDAGSITTDGLGSITGTSEISKLHDFIIDGGSF